MTESTSAQRQQTAAQPGAVPARVELDDFIEAVMRGVARAQATEEEVSGYRLAGRFAGTFAPLVIGVYSPPAPPPPPTGSGTVLA